MKSICKKLFISPFFLFVIFLSLISGLFKDVITLFLIIIIHEMGHIILSLRYGWKIKRVDIGVCGGFITYDDVIDKPFKEEFIIALSGFMFQFILFIICLFLFYLNVIDNDLFSLINKYNISIFVFNILPIYPLDGSKVLLVIFNYFLPYKLSLKLIDVISFINIILVVFCLFLFDINFEYSYIMIICFIISKLVLLAKDIPHLFNRLLFERYIYGLNKGAFVYVKGNNLSLFRRQRKHYFIIGKHYYTERKILSKRFD